MNQRPMIWMHRTRKFWFGLGLFILLLAFWLSSISKNYQLDARRESPDSYWVVALGLRHGQLEILAWYYIEPDPAVRSPDLTFSTDFAEDYGLEWGPGWELRSDRIEVKLPLWIPPLGWAVARILWMRRAGNREVKRLAESSIWAL